MAKQLGCSDEEITEAVQVAYSVGAGAIWAMANRAEKAAADHFRWWDKGAVERALARDEIAAPPGTPP